MKTTTKTEKKKEINEKEKKRKRGKILKQVHCSFLKILYFSVLSVTFKILRVCVKRS